VNGDVFYYREVFWADTGSSHGWCSFVHYLKLDQGNSVGEVANGIVCQWPQANDVDAQSLNGGNPCRAHTTARFIPGSPPGPWENETDSYPNNTTCRANGEIHAPTTFSCPTTNCKGNWDGDADFFLQLPPQFRLSLDSSYSPPPGSQPCRIFGSTEGLSNSISCGYSWPPKAVS
jgi:hypothetical protein